ncbi:unnamed protein product, partial [Symbiodinium necroappetens]
MKVLLRLAYSREVRVPRKSLEATQAWNYAFQLGEDDAIASLLLGTASIFNHAEAHRVNVRMSRVNGSMIRIVTDRAVQMGEELFTTYGSEDWFLDRHIHAAPMLPNQSAEGESHCSVAPQLPSPAVCASTTSPDPNGRGVLAQHSIAAGTVLSSPMFAFDPAYASGAWDLLAHSAGHPDLDLLVLPFLFPGLLTSNTSSPNMAAS